MSLVFRQSEMYTERETLDHSVDIENQVSHSISIHGNIKVYFIGLQTQMDILYAIHLPNYSNFQLEFFFIHYKYSDLVYCLFLYIFRH